MKNYIMAVRYLLVGVVLSAGFVDARCRGFNPKCWAREAGKGLKIAAEETGKGIETAAVETGKGIVVAANAVGKTAEQMGREIEKTGGVVAKVGVKIGNVTIKEIAKAGEVTVDIAGKAGKTVLKTGQAIVTSTGMTLVNAGGVIVALTMGDIQRVKACANAAGTSSMYGAATVLDESLKVVGSIDQLIRIESFSFEASSSELIFAGKTPKVSIKGSFLGKSFNISNVQLDLSDPNKLVADLLAMLITRFE